METVITPLSWKQNSTLRIDKPKGLPLDTQRKYMTIGTWERIWLVLINGGVKSGHRVASIAE